MLLPRGDHVIQPTQETMVRSYPDAKAFDRHAAKLATQDWTVTNTTTRQPRAGCGRILTLGFITLLRPPKPEIVVTYSRPKHKPARRAEPLPAAARPVPPPTPGSPTVRYVTCPNCGASTPDSSRFCPGCGKVRPW